MANPYPRDFFLKSLRNIIIIDDYPYKGIEFHGDPYMPIPPGYAYGDIGSESRLKIVF